MIKKVIVGICLFFAIGTFAQEGTASPYSFYGIGDIRFKGTAENRFMGGLSIFPDSTHINLQNPAGYAGLKRTTLTLGGTYATTNLQTNTGEGKPRRTTIDYLAIGIPVTNKFGFGFGLMPFSSVGYKLQSSTLEEATSIRKTNQSSGTGGVNRAFLGMGYQVTPNLSLGANFDYNFGEIETTSYEFWSVVQNGTREINLSKISGVSFNTGAMWNKRIYKKLDLFASAIYTPESTLKFANERNISLISQTSGIVVDPGEVNESNIEVKLPSKIAFGVGIGEVRKWLVGAEYTLQNTSNFGNRFSDISNATFENSSKISVGGYYIPNYNSFTSYIDRMTYRAGFRHENTGLVINEKSINDTAVTFGLGFPISGSFSNINFGLEYGKRGTKARNLVEENYLNFSLSLSLNDKWFVKRKYD